MNANQHESRKALVVVDMQNDFLPGGSLAVREVDAVIPIVNELKTGDVEAALEDLRERGVRVVDHGGDRETCALKGIWRN